MKKIDKLIIKAFLGPFVLTFVVIVFILLTVQMMNYVDEIFGKDLKWVDLGMLIFHFSVFQTPIAFPLAVMLASLMTFGNLGEHFELTAIKSAGISLLRALMPIYIMVLGITAIAFYSNNYFVPYSALKAYSLLYDIRQKKPALDIQPGQFYAGIENYKIKVDKKLADGKTLKGLTIYDHSSHKGNSEVILADSGMMYTILGDQYLKLELFNGTHYVEGEAPGASNPNRNYRVSDNINPFTRTSFAHSEMVFDLSSFGMTRTDEGLFASNRLMRNFSQLNLDMDSLQNDLFTTEGEIYAVPERYFNYSTLKNRARIPEKVQYAMDLADSLREEQMALDRTREVNENFDGVEVGVSLRPTYYINLTEPARYPRPDIEVASTRKTAQSAAIEKMEKKPKPEVDKYANLPDLSLLPGVDSSFTNKEIYILNRYMLKADLKSERLRSIKTAVAVARQIKSKLTAQNSRVDRLNKEYYVFDIQWHKMLANAIACISMFLIGAPLGAIIKRGGIGFPVIVSVIFFIIYYVLSMGGEKYAKSGAVSVEVGVWTANLLLLPIGLLFLRQAKNDTRLLEADFYKVIWTRVEDWLIKLGLISKK